MTWIKKQLDQCYKGFRKYVVLAKRVDSYVRVSSMIKAVLGSMLMTMILIAIPVLVVINMFIYAKLTVLLASLLLVIIMGAVFLYFYFYYVLLKNYHPKIEDINYKIPQLVESTMISMVLFVVGVIVISVII